jgi:integrase
LKHPKVEEPPVKVATDDDLARLLKVCGRDKLGRRDAAMIALLAYAGLRRGELCVLDLEHLDLDQGVLMIPKTKAGRPRTVPLHSEVMVRLDRYLRWRGDDPGPLFEPHRGERIRPNGVGQMMERRAKAAGVDVRAHAFRRRFATTYLRNGGNVVSLQALAGWSSPTMIASYTRMDREALAIEDYRRVMDT